MSMKILFTAVPAFCVGILLCFPSYAQTPDTMSASEKRAVILEIRELTGVASFSSKQDISKSNLSEALDPIILDDKELSQAQKDALKPVLAESKRRLEKALNDFAADSTIAGPLFEEVFIGLYDEKFTDAELRELVTFYRTPTGRKSALFLYSFIGDLSKAFSKAWSEKFRDFVKSKLDEEVNVLKKKADEAKKTAPPLNG